MRDLTMDEYQFVAGGSESEEESSEVCEEIAEDVGTTIAADGAIATAAATAIAGPIAGGVVAAATIIGGALIVSEIKEACEKHQESLERS